MSININLGAWNSVFAVPSKVVDEGLKFSDGVKLKVLLYILRSAGNTLDENTISKVTGVNVTDIPEAVEYWISMGVLQKSGDALVPNNENAEVQPVAETKEPEAAKTEAEKISEEVAETKQRFAVTKPQKPDYVFTAQRLAVDEELKFLVSEAQNALGKVLSNSDIATLLMLKDTCGLPLDVILMLIQYAISIDKGNMRTIEKLGVSWADDGINSVEAAENKIRAARLSSRQYAIVASAFGINNAGSPTKRQLEYCAKWIGEWKFSAEMLREAYERCVDSKGSMKFNYIDGILRRWHSSNVKNLNELKELESAKDKKPAESKTSYNIEELDKFETLDFIE